MASSIRTIKTIDDIDDDIMKSNPKETILFFDIDNTILRTKTDIFSDEWIKWQKEIHEETNGEHIHCASNTLDGMFKLYHIWLNDNNYETEVLEWHTRAYIDRYISYGFKVILITARSKATSQVTFEHVASHYDVPNLYQDISFEDDEVLFKHGILFTDGKNKGVYMNKLFEKINYIPNNVFYIDDSLVECENVAKENKSTNMRIYHYTYSQKYKDLFDQMDKEFLHDKLLSYIINRINTFIR